MARRIRPHQKQKHKLKLKRLHKERWFDVAEFAQPQSDAGSADSEAVTEDEMIRPREAKWPDWETLQQPIDYDYDKQFLCALLFSYYYYLKFFYLTHLPTAAKMSETLQELADIPKDFLRDGSQFIRRCTKRESIRRFCCCDQC
jgi:hypothetical protein